jgi:hypothetical protein
MDHDDALAYMLGECSFSALAFQEWIHNDGYLDLRAEDALPPEETARRMVLLDDMLDVANRTSAEES